jgi:hypothetical protein
MEIGATPSSIERNAGKKRLGAPEDLAAADKLLDKPMLATIQKKTGESQPINYLRAPQGGLSPPVAKSLINGSKEVGLNLGTNP